MTRSKTIKPETAYLSRICRPKANRLVLTRVIPHSQQTGLFSQGMQGDSPKAATAYSVGTARRGQVTTTWRNDASRSFSERQETVPCKRHSNKTQPVGKGLVSFGYDYTQPVGKGLVSFRNLHQRGTARGTFDAITNFQRKGAPCTYFSQDRGALAALRLSQPKEASTNKLHGLETTWAASAPRVSIYPLLINKLFDRNPRRSI